MSVGYFLIALGLLFVLDNFHILRGDVWEYGLAIDIDSAWRIHGHKTVREDVLENRNPKTIRKNDIDAHCRLSEYCEPRQQGPLVPKGHETRQARNQNE